MSRTGATDSTLVFALKYVADDGTEREFHVDQVKPLGFAAFRECLRGGRRSHPTVMCGTACDQNGAPVGGRVKITCSLEFNERIPFYALVAGGALPPMYLPQGCVMVLDRNVVAGLTRREVSPHPEAAGERFLLDFLNSATLKINPVLGAFEGSTQRSPTFAEFRVDVQATARAVRQRLPLVKVIEFKDEILLRLHEFRLSFDERAKLESQFLATVAPLLRDSVATSRLAQVEEAVLAEARSRGIEGNFVVLTALAKLYESPKGTDGGAARSLLKLTKPHTEAAAYNALADLRQLELLAGSQCLSQSVALLTGDKALALLWCGLGVEEVRAGPRSTRMSVRLALELFPRLASDRRELLFAAK